MSKSNSENTTTLNRRQALLLPATAGMGIALARPARALDSTKIAAHQEPGNCTTPRSAVANTQYGRVRGFLDGGVLTFKGVQYGQDTSGENRWLPAKPPKPWEGEYPALIYGANCPQRLHDYTGIEQSFLQDWDDGYMSEDMLKLNIWTPSLTGKRPVMVYFHGGGFTFGSSYELPSQEGAQLARHHDVVAVSVNHRLNALGFLDLSEIGGPAYADSVNVGMTDLGASLRWVRANIANFGGDPGSVMIYGQSGGGSKVTCLGDRSKLPSELQVDVQPKIRSLVMPVYPYELLRGDVTGSAEVAYVVDDQGRVASSRVVKADRPEFGLALQAAVERFEYEPAIKNGRPNKALLAFEQDFLSSSHNIVTGVEYRLLRLERAHPERIGKAGGPDSPVRALVTRSPIFPRSLLGHATRGDALVELLIDEEGNPRLSRVVSASEPAFGYSAAEAAALWRFSPPTSKGKAVVTRVRVPFVFDFANPAPENGNPQPT